MGIRELCVTGLATDYCVRNTVMDALKLGFSVDLLVDCVRGVNVLPADSDRAIEEMVSAGAKQASSGDLL